MSERYQRKNKYSINTGWKTYLLEAKEKIVKENPDVTKREIYSIASKMWEDLSSKEKSVYSRKEKRHNARKRNNSSSDSDELFDNEKVKQHISPHSVFVNEKQVELKETKPELTLLERTNIIVSMWNDLKPEEKHIYENKAKRYNRRIDKESTDSDEEKYIITKHVKDEENNDTSPTETEE